MASSCLLVSAALLFSSRVPSPIFPPPLPACRNRAFQSRTMGVTVTVHVDAHHRVARFSLRGMGVDADGVARIAGKKHTNVFRGTGEGSVEALRFDVEFERFLERKGVRIEGVEVRDGELVLPVHLPLLGRRTVRLKERCLGEDLAGKELG